jgi:hypothetical protein
MKSGDSFGNKSLESFNAISDTKGPQSLENAAPIELWSKRELRRSCYRLAIFWAMYSSSLRSSSSALLSKRRSLFR